VEGEKFEGDRVRFKRGSGTPCGSGVGPESVLLEVSHFREFINHPASITHEGFVQERLHDFHPRLTQKNAKRKKLPECRNDFFRPERLIAEKCLQFFFARTREAQGPARKTPEKGEPSENTQPALQWTRAHHPSSFRRWYCYTASRKQS